MQRVKRVGFDTKTGKRSKGYMPSPGYWSAEKVCKKIYNRHLMGGMRRRP